jgi:hypothetical protein
MYVFKLSEKVLQGPRILVHRGKSQSGRGMFQRLNCS